MSRDCELWADDLFDWGEHPVLSVEAVTDVTREAGAFRWDWAVPFENYGIDAYGQVTFSNQYGIGLNAEGAVMAHGEIPLDESGTVKAAGNVQIKGFVNSDYMVQTQYEVTLYEWDVYVNGRADLMAWDTYLNLGVRANQSAYHEYFISIQVEEGETFLLDELNFSAHFDTGNFNPFASELGLSVQDIEISTPYWEPENNEEAEWSYDNEEEEEQEPEDEDITIVPITAEDDLAIDEEMPSLDQTPIQSGCNTSNGWLWAWILGFLGAIQRRILRPLL